MESEVDTLRSRLLGEINQERRQHREASINNRRGELEFQERTYFEDDVVGVANKLKAKGYVSADELRVLKNAVIQSEDNISAFFQVYGALHGLVKEFTGSDTGKQLLAAECLCNMSLGPPKTCSSIAKAAGVYLITYVGNPNSSLLDTCAWTLGNLAASDVKVATLLEAQGVFDQLIESLDCVWVQDHVNAIAYALGHFLMAIPHPNEFQKFHKFLNISNKKYKFDTKEVARLLFILTSYEMLVPHLQQCKVFGAIISDLLCLVNRSHWEINVLVIDSLLRAAANLASDKAILSIEYQVLVAEETIYALNTLLKCQYVDIKNDTLWFLGNIYTNNVHNSSWKQDFFEQLSLES